jgi:hypothetical protein
VKLLFDENLSPSVGNAGTAAIARLIQSRIETIRKFDADPEQSLLVLEGKATQT